MYKSPVVRATLGRWIVGVWRIWKWFLYYGGWFRFLAAPKGVPLITQKTQKCPTDPERD